MMTDGDYNTFPVIKFLTILPARDRVCALYFSFPPARPLDSGSHLQGLEEVGWLRLEPAFFVLGSV